MSNGKEHGFWLTNVSRKNVCLSDLAITIPAKRSMNLLDPKHFTYTLEQLEQSAASGSIFIKRDKIKVRNVAPDVVVKPGIYVLNESRGTKPRSLLQIVEKRYEELNVSDEKFDEEFAAIIELDKK